MEFATVIAASLNPGGILAWIVVGLIAGFLAGQVMRGGGYGIVGDVIMGVVGAFIGGLLADFFLPTASFGFWGSVVVAFIGACVVIAIVRAISGGTRRTL